MYICSVENKEGTYYGTFDFDVKEKLEFINKDFEPIPINKKTGINSYLMKRDFLSEVDAFQRKQLYTIFLNS